MEWGRARLVWLAQQPHALPPARLAWAHPPAVEQAIWFPQASAKVQTSGVATGLGER